MGINNEKTGIEENENMMIKSRLLCNFSYKIKKNVKNDLFIKDYSIFPQETIDVWYSKRTSVVIKMTYNVALEKRITLGTMTEHLGIHPQYYGFYSLTNEQFLNLVKLGQANADYFIY